jgi:hypothetical protein
MFIHVLESRERACLSVKDETEHKPTRPLGLGPQNHLAVLASQALTTRRLTGKKKCPTPLPPNKPAIGEGMDKSTLAHAQIQIIIIHFLPSPISLIPNG